jgi:hypothetical protein
MWREGLPNIENRGRIKGRTEIYGDHAREAIGVPVMLGAAFHRLK